MAERTADSDVCGIDDGWDSCQEGAKGLTTMASSDLRLSHR